MKTYKDFKKIISNDVYPSKNELVYRHGFTHDEVKTFPVFKVKDPDYTRLPMMDEEGLPLYYWMNKAILNRFIAAHEQLDTLLLTSGDAMLAEFKQGFLLSEIESTLSLEGVRSTRQQIIRLQKNKDKDIVDKNDRIVKNMLNAYEYIQDQPITEKTIFELYQILTYQSLASTDQFKKGQLYRDGPVSIYNSQQVEIDRGVRFDLLPSMMKAFIDFVNHKKDLSGHLIASHVLHYALIYIHPYFDYNGRMARVLSYWYNLRYAPSLSLLMVASMINHSVQKKGYYQAIQASRQMGNDLTFFLDFIGRMMIAHLDAYDHQHRFLMQLKSKGMVVSRGEAMMMKDILLMPLTTQGYFTWKDYQSSKHVEVTQSKQYVLRLLQRLVSLDFLTVIEVSKQKLFKLRPMK